MSNSRQILGGFIPAVQDIDSTKNNNIRDVIGGKLDTHSGSSLYSLMKTANEHIHNEQRCYPTLSDPVTVTGSGSAWTLGAFAEIVPINTITSDFDIHFVNISAISANDEFEIALYAATTFLTCVAFTKSAAGQPNTPLPLITALIPANTQIQAKLANKAALARTVDIKILYHLY